MTHAASVLRRTSRRVAVAIRRTSCRLAPLFRRSVATALAVLLVAAVWLRLGPLPPGLLDAPPAASTVVTDRHGVPLYEALSGDGTRAMQLHAGSLPETLVNATLAAEDRRFWWHPGIDPLAIARAVRTNVVQGRAAEGASTISQQVAKLLLARGEPRRQRGWRGKAEEAILALRLEHRLTKRELLAQYLNLAAYGNQFVGAERASRAYFGVPASMLTTAQAAFIAGLPQRPSGFNPYRHREAALARQQVVLRRMEAGGWIMAAEAAEARDERLAIFRAASAFRAPHFVEMVLAANAADRPARLTTTLDAGLQSDVTGVIAAHRAALRRHAAGNVAVVVLDNRSGEWLAWEGSGDYFDLERGGTINGAVAPRQPGSALKPFTYALAFERGWSPASVLPDVPSTFPTAEPGVVYSPRNYDNRYRGPLLARRALAGSENVPAVVLASEMGVADVRRFLQRAGLTTLDRTASHYGLGLTLGNAEVRLDQLVAAYATFARGGEWIEPTWRLDTERRPQERRRLVSPRTAFWITDILSDDEAREYAFGRGGSLEFPFPVAVKTGTSQAYHDNWTIGYSKHVTVGVWVGNLDRRPLRNSSGVTGAGPIFQAVMLAAERRYQGGALDLGGPPIVDPPSGIVRVEICTLSGQRSGPWCPSRASEWVSDAPVPCTWHQHTADGPVTFYPPEYAPWAARALPQGGHRISSAAVGGPAVRPAQQASAPTALPALRIVTPAEGATYSIDPTLRREFQTLALKAIAQEPGPLEWRLGDQLIGTADAASALDWPLLPGRHQLSARDRHGRSATVTITVR